jgi:superfamily I DNA/RNA helicase
LDLENRRIELNKKVEDDLKLNESIYKDDEEQLKLIQYRFQEAIIPPFSVYGIMNIKGLEFENVAIVDFFCEDAIDEVCQKHWKHLVLKLEAKSDNLKGQPPNYPLPELEIQLKLLYTAITRARSVLYVIERKESKEESPAFTKWRDYLKAKSLVDRTKLSEIKTVSRKILSDDIRHEGIWIIYFNTINFLFHN